MSGIAGIFNPDGASVQAPLVAAMAEALWLRGPDARDVWVEGNVALVHTMLRADEGMQREKQPCSLDGTVWIVADARVDARADLVNALAAQGRTGLASATDPELILHAYHAWGEACMDHLLGDFAFAIWDADKRRLVCARDPMGVKPFFYSHFKQAFVFSNTLNCVRLHPMASLRLDDLAIADFLLFGYNQEADSTMFADIRRLPAGHCVRVSSDGVQIRRYWDMPIDEPISYPRKDDYADRFIELLHAAVNDRLRTALVGVFMSGGLDSPTLAAVACDLQRARGGASEVRAFTTLPEDPTSEAERHYASLAAQHLKIPIDFRVMSDEPFESSKSMHIPEPSASPFELIAERSYYSRIARHSRVFLYGEGPDNALLYEWRPYLAYLWRKRAWGRMVAELLSHAISHRRVPLLSTVPRMVKQRYVRPWWQPEFPDWINQSLVSRLNLRERWNLHMTTDHLAVHPIRPRAYNSLNSALWPALFEDCDAANTGVPIEFRHPFVDLRLLRFMLRIPVLPWCRVKYLLRYAMRASLPKEILRRPKAPLVGAPIFEKVHRCPLPVWTPSGLLLNYVDSNRAFPEAQDNPMVLMGKLRVAGLNSWFETTYRQRLPLSQGEIP